MVDGATGCNHAKGGLCAKCFVSPSTSLHSVNNSRNGHLANESSESRSDAVDEVAADLSPVPASSFAHTYTSFADLQSSVRNVRIQEESNLEQPFPIIAPLVEPESWLMRMLQSDRFTSRMALRYLNRTKDKGELTALGTRLDSLPDTDMDFYLPELANLYIHDKAVASVLYPYLTKRCKQSVHFSLQCVWLLESFNVDQLRFRDKSMVHGSMLKQMILNEFRDRRSMNLLQKAEMAPSLSLKPTPLGLTAEMLSLESAGPLATTLSRSESASSSLSNLHCLSPLALTKDRKLDSSCKCKKPREKCECEETCLHAEKRFVAWLTTIGDRLKEEPGKGEKTRRLVSELMLLNMQLPARVWVPLSADHIVLRIPPTNGCVLNSKDKAPYCIYVEILRCADVMTVAVPKSRSEAESALQYSLRKGSSVDIPRESSTLSEPNMPAHANAGEETAGKENSEETSGREEEQQITVVECRDETIVSPDQMLEAVPAPEPAWDTMSLESSASEPVLRTGAHLTADLSRRLKEWVKRPGRRRQMRPHPDDPSASTLSEPWEEKRERIRGASPYGELQGWDLLPLIVKSGDDLAQELLAYQLLETFKHIWAEEEVPLYLRPYKILVTSSNSGMIEPIIDACSLHQIKRNQYAIYKEEGHTTIPSLLAYYVETFGPKGTPSFLKAQQNLVQSCAAYSLVSYFLQVKDRHNGNILIDADGHLIHIDFGFILSVSPRNLGFETSPFKLTSELIDVMGGLDCDMFAYFKSLLLRGLIAARKHHEEIMTIVEIMSIGSHLPCFRAAAPAIRAMRERFHVTCTDQQLHQLVDSMIETSRDSLTTRLYDNFQYYTNGIL